MHKAVIVDDDHLNLRVLSAMLTQFGYEVFTAGTGSEGVDLVKEVQPDIVMMDLLMPFATLDGSAATRAIQETTQCAHIPIIAVSAADIQTIRDMINEGLFYDFIQKPITLEKLEALLERIDRRNTA